LKQSGKAIVLIAESDAEFGIVAHQQSNGREPAILRIGHVETLENVSSQLSPAAWRNQ
jgi:hypothetical protein